MHKTTARFRKCLDLLPNHIKNQSAKCFLLLKNDPGHPSLHFKKVGLFWSVRIGIAYRALALKEGRNYIWVWIGNHDDYMKLINSNTSY
jgi:hypothetical protein